MLMEVSILFFSVPTASRDDFLWKSEIAEAEGESESFASRGNWDHCPLYFYFFSLVFQQFRLLSKPVTVVRGVTKEAVDMLDATREESSLSKRIVLS